MLLQAFYSIRSERQLMERIEFDLLYRWFIGLGIDDPAWTVESFLARLGWQEHQAVIFCHDDKPHAHVHVMLNTVHPETGRVLNAKHERRCARAWGEDHERAHGLIFCEGRLKPPSEFGLGALGAIAEIGEKLFDGFHRKSQSLRLPKMRARRQRVAPTRNKTGPFSRQATPRRCLPIGTRGGSEDVHGTERGFGARSTSRSGRLPLRPSIRDDQAIACARIAAAYDGLFHAALARLLQQRLTL